MDFNTFMELVGYFASFLVLVSLLMSSVVKLRIINSVGSAIYVVYALVIHSYPTALMNLGLVIINIYYLIRIRSQRVGFHLVGGGLAESGTRNFLAVHKDDIRLFFPNFDFDAQSADAYFVYVGSDPVGLMVAQKTPDGTLEITLDYTTQQYRDCSVGTFLYQELAKSGIRRLCARADTQKHAQYLAKMGFAEESGTYVKNL